MKLDEDVENADVVDVRGNNTGTAVKLGGGGVAAALIVVVVAKLFGVDISGLLGGGSDPAAPTPSTQSAQSGSIGSNAPPPDDKQLRRIKAMMKDIQDTFEAQFKTKGIAYRHAKLYVFTEAIDTGCGRSSAEVGPFYCPADENAYIDLSFYQELAARFGAPGEFAQAYVLAHEIGHHLQKMLGYEAKARRFHSNGSKIRDEGSVRLELQADCFAGVWGNSAAARKILEVGEPEQALTAAAAIGDDRLQKDAGIDVNSETWTHGSSEQRTRWFRKGFESGSLDACDTFVTPTL